MDTNGELVYIQKMNDTINGPTKKTIIKNIHASLVQKMIDHITLFDNHFSKYKQYYHNHNWVIHRNQEA